MPTTMPTDTPENPPPTPLKNPKRTDTLLDHLHTLARATEKFDTRVQQARATHAALPKADDILWAAVHLGRLLIHEGFFPPNLS
jgi:hypothetical protein